MVKFYLGKERRGPVLIVAVEDSTRACGLYQRVAAAAKSLQS